MTRITIGIDPGLDGALAVIDERTDPPTITVHDTPTLTLTGRRGRRRREYDLSVMTNLLAPYARSANAVLEWSQARPGQGVRSMWTMGYGAGVWEGLLAGLGIASQRVRPQRWQQTMLDGMLRGKDASRLVAMRRFPELAPQLRRKKDHGRADALLIAAWGQARADALLIAALGQAHLP